MCDEKKVTASRRRQKTAADHIMDAFGSNRYWMRLTGNHRCTVQAWRDAGIPSKYWNRIFVEAMLRDIPGITFDALAKTKPDRDTEEARARRDKHNEKAARYRLTRGDAVKASQAKWKMAHPDKVAKRSVASAARAAAARAANPEKARAVNRAASTRWRKANKAKKAAYNAAYRAANKAELAARCKARPGAYREGIAAYRAANHERLAAWRAANHEKLRAYKRNRRARERGNGGTHTADDIKEIAAQQKYKCAYCGVSVRSERHVDHIMPLKLGGSNDRSNLQLLCVTCNLRKQAKHPIDFAQQLGRLL